MSFCNLNNHPSSRFKFSFSKNYFMKKSTFVICFSGAHLASQSTSSYCCNKCKGKHHFSICTSDETKNSKQDNWDDDSTLTNFSTDKNTVSLKTAYAKIKNPKHSQKMNTDLLFDLRCQRSCKKITYNSNRKFKNKGF